MIAFGKSIRPLFYIVLLVIVFQTIPSYVLAAFTLSKPPYTYALSSGLVGHWTFDGPDMPNGVARDRSGSGNHGNLVSIATSTFYTLGKIAQGLRFDGVNDKISLQSINNLKSDDGTICMWAKLPPTADAYAGYYTLYNVAAPFNYVTEFVAGNNWSAAMTNELFGFVIWSGGNVRSLSYTSATRTELFDDQWHHMCVTADTSYKLYLDGVSKTVTMGVGSDDGLFTSNTPELDAAEIGTFTDDDAYVEGVMDDVRAYNRALSATEITQLYRFGLAKFDVTPKQKLTDNTGLVGHWTFDGPDMAGGVARDRSTTAAHGNVQNIATTTFYTLGKIGQGIRLDGTDDYIDVGDVSTFDFGTSNFSISAWFNLDATDNAVKIMTSKYNAGGTPGYSLQVENDKLFAFVRDGTGAGGDEFIEIIGSTNIPANEWHHAVVTFDRGGNSALYLDGVSDATPVSLALLSGSVSNAVQLLIGRRLGGTVNYFPGKLDDIRIYNRVLTAAEASQLYNMGR